MAKSAEAFRTISEVSELLQTPAHVLRFWESRFTQVKPVKRAGGRRYYRPSDLALLGGIKRLLHDDGMTIRGVQKVLREQGVRHVAALSPVELGPEADQTTPAPDEVRPPAAEPAVTRAQANVTPLWPGAPSPEVAEGGDALLPDPDDLASPIAGEAPMMPDAEPAPDGHGDAVRSFAAADREEAPPLDASPPAATLLRAMDVLRARAVRSELTSVYDRLHALRDRVARSDGTDRD